MNLRGNTGTERRKPGRAVRIVSPTGAGAGVTDEPAPTLLTQRERQVLLLLINGATNRALARHLGIAERTLRAHLTSISRKLCLSSRVEAALYAYRHHESLLAMQPGDADGSAEYHRGAERAIA